MTTTTPAKQEQIESIEVMDDTVMFITNESTAKKLLKRNPRARVIKGSAEDDRYAVIYSTTDVNLINGVKRA